MEIVNSDDVIVEIQYSYDSRDYLFISTYQYLDLGHYLDMAFLLKTQGENQDNECDGS